MLAGDGLDPHRLQEGAVEAEATREVALAGLAGPVVSGHDRLACRHSQQSFSLERMGQAQAQAFDAAIRTVLDDLMREGELTLRDGRLDLSAEAQVVWGLGDAALPVCLTLVQHDGSRDRGVPVRVDLAATARS